MKVPKVVTTYSPGDVCFAKVRGFPAWPALVVALAEENAAKQFRYHVSFFGTNEIGLMKGDEMLDYSNKDKLVKTIKRKGFQEGIAAMEAYLETKGTPAAQPEPPAEVEEPTVAAATDEEPPLVIDEKPSEPRKSVAGKKRASSKSSPQSDAVSNVTSRSGRKIKPRKFSDGDEALRPRKYAREGAVLECSDAEVPNYTEDDAEGMPILDYTDEVDLPGRTLLAKLPTGQLCRLKVDLMRPETFPSDEARERWDAAVASSALRLKAQLRSGEFTVEQHLAKNRTVFQAQAARMEELQHGKKQRLKWLQIEYHMLQLDLMIRSSLGLNAAQVDTCLPLLDELAATQMDPLMLKKHPQVVDTIMKLRRYVGNVTQWQLTEEQQVEFQQKAQQVRLKAEFLYNKLKTLFLVPANQRFWSVFTNSLQAFEEKTAGMDKATLYKLTVEPATREAEQPAPPVPEQLPAADKAETGNGATDSDDEVENRPPSD